MTVLSLASKGESYQIEVLHGERLQHSFMLCGRAVLGRQLNPREAQWQLARHEASGDDRMAIAAFSDVRVSRRQLQLVPVASGIEVENTSTNPVLIDHRAELAPGARRVLTAPCRLAFGPDASYVVAVWPGDTSALEMHTLPHQAPAPTPDATDEGLTALAPLILSEKDTEAVRVWLKAITEVLRSATGANDFLQRAVRRVVSLMRFDAARVLMLQDGQWACQAEHCRNVDRTGSTSVASQRILRRTRDERRTIWQDVAQLPAGDFSQAGVSAIISSPIRNRQGEVIGALYADRRAASGPADVKISSAEAMLVETLAFGIAAGLERTRQDEELVEQRVRFGQFFGAALGEQLAANPSLLDSKDAEVTVLVVDIRGFSGISERVGTERSLAWIRDTLDVLTSIVMTHGGVVVDYVGDEMMAMWGAPVPQPDQARRAGQAALEMLVALGPHDEKWKPLIGEATRVGIGIHSGTAQVGNVGSRRKFKYGPLGHTVNLASRLQGATRHLQTTVLASMASHHALGPGFITRRLGAIGVQNIEAPVDVYELRLASDDRSRTLCELYEKALAEFEAQEFRRAARTLGDYLPNYQDDGPSHILLWRAVNWLVHPEPAFDRAWKLPGK
jgi:Adenylate cyclase, family 3 (some proteins contain HAMP domain)